MNTGTCSACKYNTDSFLATFQNVINHLCHHSHAELGRIDIKNVHDIIGKTEVRKGTPSTRTCLLHYRHHFGLSYCFNENAENNVILP